MDEVKKILQYKVKNALRDISQKHKTLVAGEVQTWDTSDKRILFTYKLASKFLE